MFKKIVLNFLGLMVIGTLTFRNFATHSNIIGPAGMVLILGPHLKPD